MTGVQTCALPISSKFSFVRDHDTNENFEEYRQVIGKIMGSLLMDVEDKLWRKYPELRPKQMDGLSEVDESIIKPRFYTCKNENGT